MTLEEERERDAEPKECHVCRRLVCEHCDEDQTDDGTKPLCFCCLNDHRAEIERLQAVALCEHIEALHPEDGTRCRGCRRAYPCPTLRTLWEFQENLPPPTPPPKQPKGLRMTDEQTQELTAAIYNVFRKADLPAQLDGCSMSYGGKSQFIILRQNNTKLVVAVHQVLSWSQDPDFNL